jgi:hypothetical protein
MNIIDIPSDVFIRYFMNTADESLIAHMLYHVSKTYKAKILSCMKQRKLCFHCVSRIILSNLVKKTKSVFNSKRQVKKHWNDIFFLSTHYGVRVSHDTIQYVISMKKSHLLELQPFQQYAYNNSVELLKFILDHCDENIIHYYIRRLKINFDDIVNDVLCFNKYDFCNFNWIIENHIPIDSSKNIITLKTLDECTKIDNIYGFNIIKDILISQGDYNSHIEETYRKMAIEHKAFDIYLELNDDKQISKEEHRLIAESNDYYLMIHLQHKKLISYVSQYYKICVAKKYDQIFSLLLSFNYDPPSDILTYIDENSFESHAAYKGYYRSVSLKIYSYDLGIFKHRHK